MGNSQTALSGIHPFRDDNAPPPIRPIQAAEFTNLTIPEIPIVIPPSAESIASAQQQQQQPQQLSLAAGWTSITSDPQPEKFDDLFISVRAPTPPPRRISYNEAGKPNRRIPKQGFLGRGFSSLRTLPRLISRPDLAKIRGFFKRKRIVGEVYPVPPDAEKPSPPSRPEVFHEQDEFFLLRWDPPAYDGGLPIIGYIIQHLELGLPQVDATVEKDDTQSWFSSEPGQVTSTEVLLNNLIPGTTYQFRVIAENLLGFSQPGEISKPIVFNPHGELDDWFCPPVLIIGLDESYTVIEHERLVLAIEITGQPYPIVKWYGSQGVELGKVLDPVKYSVVSCGNRRVLTINAVDCGDSGVIRCVGENERGVVECSCVIVVEAPPHVRRVLRSDLIKLENPYELSKDEERMVRRQDKNEDELIFQSGELARFKFLYSGSPAPNVCVYHEGDLVDGEEVVGSGKIFHERVNTEVTDNLITVKISGVKRTDRGEWTVRLDNVLGEDSASALVTVSDRPSEPGKPDVLQLSDNTVILKWDQPYDDGGCPVSGYVVEYFRSEWGVWLKACTTKNPYTKIRDLIPGSKYTFRVKAENLYGMSDPSSESVELLITDLASTLRSVTGDGEGALLMKTVVEEEEEAVKIEEEEPGKKRQGSSISLNRVSAGTMTDLSALGKAGGGGEEISKGRSLDAEPATANPAKTVTITHSSTSPQPPRKTLRLESPPHHHATARTPSPSRLLKVTLQPQVVIPEDNDEYADEEDDFLVEYKPAQLSPSPIRRSPSPLFAQALAPVQRSPSPVAPPRTRTIIQQPTHVDEEAIALTRSQPDYSLFQSSLRVPPPRARHQLSPSGDQEKMSLQQQHQQQRVISPVSIPPVVHQVETTKKLYSRSEIIKSAATAEEHFYYVPESEETGEEGHVDEPEEDPELLKVKEALSKDDHLFDDLDDEEDFDEDEIKYDFDKLQEEYEEDKKRGIVSRQDSGVSARSEEHSGVSRGESFNEEEDVEDDRRSVMSEVLPKKIVHRMGSFERAQSEVVSRSAFSADLLSSSKGEQTRGDAAAAFREGLRVEEIEPDVELVPPPVEPRRTVSPSPQQLEQEQRRSLFEHQPRSSSFQQQRSSSYQQQRSASQGGSRPMLHDRYNDLIMMRVASRNKAVGSSLRSLNSSRYSSSENVEGSSRDSGRSSMVQQQLEQGEGKSFVKREFSWREFNPEQESEAVKSLERSVSVGGKGLSIFRVSQQRFLSDGVGEAEEVEVKKCEDAARGGAVDVATRRFDCAFVSTPEIYSSERGDGGKGGVLEHSRSESCMGESDVILDGLKERVAICHVPGGVDYETEEESYVEGGFSAISEEASGSGGGGAHSGGGGGEVDRDLPRDREGMGKRLRKRVSFGSSDVEEISWDDGGRGWRVMDRGNDYEHDEDDQEGLIGEGFEGEEEGEGAEHEMHEEGMMEQEGHEHEGEMDEEREYAEQEEAYEGGLEGEEDDPDREGVEGQHEYEEEMEEHEHEEGFEEEEEHEHDEIEGDHHDVEGLTDYVYDDEEFEDDGEVFEMDIEGIDPRVYTESDEFEGEDDSGVMYVLLEPEEVKLRDLSEFEAPSFAERDEKLESLLQKIDQFLGEEDEQEEIGEGGELRESFIEEIGEELEIGDDQVIVEEEDKLALLEEEEVEEEVVDAGGSEEKFTEDEKLEEGKLEEEKFVDEEKLREVEKLVEEEKIAEEKLGEDEKLAEEEKFVEEKFTEEKLAEKEKFVDEEKIAEGEFVEIVKLTEEEKLVEEAKLVDEEKLEEDEFVEKVEITEEEKWTEDKILDEGKLADEKLEDKITEEELTEVEKIEEEKLVETEKLTEDFLDGDKLAEEEKVVDEVKFEEDEFVGKVESTEEEKWTEVKILDEGKLAEEKLVEEKFTEEELVEVEKIAEEKFAEVEKLTEDFLGEDKLVKDKSPEENEKSDLQAETSEELTSKPNKEIENVDLEKVVELQLVSDDKMLHAICESDSALEEQLDMRRNDQEKAPEEVTSKPPDNGVPEILTLDSELSTTTILQADEILGSEDKPIKEASVVRTDESANVIVSYDEVVTPPVPSAEHLPIAGDNFRGCKIETEHQSEAKQMIIESEILEEISPVVSSGIDVVEQQIELRLSGEVEKKSTAEVESVPPPPSNQKLIDRVIIEDIEAPQQVLLKRLPAVEPDLQATECAIDARLPESLPPTTKPECKVEKKKPTPGHTFPAAASVPAPPECTLSSVPCDKSPPHKPKNPRQQRRDLEPQLTERPKSPAPTRLSSTKQPTPPPPAPHLDNTTQILTLTQTEERITPPAPPPRPSTTFSYKHYMTERQQRPAPQQQQPLSSQQHRSSPRSTDTPSRSTTTSLSSLPTVREEPSRRSSPTPYAPNLSAYEQFRIRPLHSTRSASSSTQELPQTRCLVFRSPTEEQDPPVTIAYIRARIEQNANEILKPLAGQQPGVAEGNTQPQVKVKEQSSPVVEAAAAPISPFMNYLFNAAFYLMLSPMLLFVDSLMFGLLALLLVACVHFFFIRE